MDPLKTLPDRARHTLLEYFRDLVSDTGEAAAEVDWRISCFDSGLGLASMLEERGVPVEGARVLDVACGWGGHAVAFASRDARVSAADLNDHAFARLARVVDSMELPVSLFRADAQRVGCGTAAFDIILALELVEHLPNVDEFAAEVARLLAPGGVCVVSTPPRLRSILSGEPHYQLRGLAALPFALQGPVARGMFGRIYPFPITRQYGRASSVFRPFERHGLEGEVMLRGRASRLSSRMPALRPVLESTLWDLLLIRKPTAKAGSAESRTTPN